MSAAATLCGMVKSVGNALKEGGMRTYMYIVAYYATKKDVKDGIISFKHKQIQAKDVEDAYDVGPRELKFKNKMGYLNDYVAEVKIP